MPIPMQVASRAGGFGWRKLDGRWEKGSRRRCFFVCNFVCETSATRCHVVAGQKTRSTGQQHRKSLQNSNWRCVCRRLISMGQFSTKIEFEMWLPEQELFWGANILAFRHAPPRDNVFCGEVFENVLGIPSFNLGCHFKTPNLFPLLPASHKTNRSSLWWCCCDVRCDDASTIGCLYRLQQYYDDDDHFEQGRGGALMFRRIIPGGISTRTCPSTAPSFGPTIAVLRM